MSHPGWGALAEKPSCGREGCFVHRLNNDIIQQKWFDKAFHQTIHSRYLPSELTSLKAAANGMG